MRIGRSLTLGVLIAALVFAAATELLPARVRDDATPAGPAPARSAIVMIDGDTLIDRAADITYRIANIDTPEAGARARCEAERAAADRATQAARRLIADADDLDLRPTGRIDRYGRAIAFVQIDGRDLGETLIAEGHARPWRGRREPWCDARGRLIP